jgi:hypothetical protein
VRPEPSPLGPSPVGCNPVSCWGRPFLERDGRGVVVTAEHAPLFELRANGVRQSRMRSQRVGILDAAACAFESRRESGPRSRCTGRSLARRCYI